MLLGAKCRAGRVIAGRRVIGEPRIVADADNGARLSAATPIKNSMRFLLFIDYRGFCSLNNANSPRVVNENVAKVTGLLPCPVISPVESGTQFAMIEFARADPLLRTDTISARRACWPFGIDLGRTGAQFNPNERKVIQ